MAGKRHTLARVIDSKIVPWFDAPSPKKHTPTPPVFFSFAASAAPHTSGPPAPTIPFAPSMPFDRSAMCIEPPLPLHTPDGRCFLAGIQMHEAGNLARRELDVQALFELANGAHQPVRFQQFFPAQLI